MPLRLTVDKHELIAIGEEITVRVVERVGRHKTRVEIDAPRNMPIVRGRIPQLERSHSAQESGGSC